MLKNKKILIIIMFFILLLIFNTSCFAFTYSDLSANNQSYVKNVINDIFTDCKEKYGDMAYYCVVFGTDINNPKVGIAFSDSSDSFSFTGSGFKGRLILYEKDYGVETLYNYDNRDNYGEYGVNYSNVVYSNIDSYGVPIVPNDFFLVAPPGIITQAVEQMEMKEVMTEIIQIIPLIIVVVVSLVGLRKGLQMLSNLLHRCLIILIHLVKILF